VSLFTRRVSTSLNRRFAHRRKSQKAAAAFQGALEIAIRDVVTAEVDHLMIGVSALSFMGGVDGGQKGSLRVNP
jgi:hypothetical protein